MIIRYADDAERKRAEYVLDVFSSKLKVRKPGGSVVIVNSSPEDLEELLEELYSRLPGGVIKVYKLEEYKPGVEPKRTILTVRTSMGVEEASGAIAAIMASMKGAQISAAGGVRTYLLALKGGRLTARVEILPHDSGSIVRVELEGYGRVFEKARDTLSRRLSLIGEVSVG